MDVVGLIRHMFGAFGIEVAIPPRDDKIDLVPTAKFHPFLSQYSKE